MNPEIPPPLLLSLLICDQTITDIETKKHSLIGVFEAIFALKYPTVLPYFSIFGQLTNGRGTINLNIKTLLSRYKLNNNNWL